MRSSGPGTGDTESDVDDLFDSYGGEDEESMFDDPEDVFPADFFRDDRFGGEE